MQQGASTFCHNSIRTRRALRSHYVCQACRQRQQPYPSHFATTARYIGPSANSPDEFRGTILNQHQQQRERRRQRQQESHPPSNSSSIWPSVTNSSSIPERSPSLPPSQRLVNRYVQREVSGAQVRSIPVVSGTKPGFRRSALNRTVPITASTLSSLRSSERRSVHSSHKIRHSAVSNHELSPTSRSTAPVPHTGQYKGIRAELAKWQELHGQLEPLVERFAFDGILDPAGYNQLAENPDQDDDSDRAQAISQSMHASMDDPTSSVEPLRVLRMGDLLEIDGSKLGSPEPVVAAFVRHVNLTQLQVFALSGKWLYVSEAEILHRVRGWISPELIEPILDHIPPLQTTMQDMLRLKQVSDLQDISIPRSVSAPIVKRLSDFYAELQDVYRSHASKLDSAHDILAHSVDLRYGSLVSVASTLLETPSSALTDAAICAVRRALLRHTLAFDLDRRSHRLTGYLQIRSKELIRLLQVVQGWIREWQEDKAAKAFLPPDKRKQRRSPPGAMIIPSFLQKARSIVLESRHDRQPTLTGTIGPSTKRFAITEDSEAVRISKTEEFTVEESEIIRFLEAWVSHHMFMHDARFRALPPLILQALGLYEGYEYNIKTGSMFLQELGVLLPYENRVRHDPHLLLPSSQHSRPLMKLWGSVVGMSKEPDFIDSMKDLRRDWGELPVYCIDKAGAEEIDDGISVEAAGVDLDGKPTYWVHVHVANPTAFFSKDHDVAKMARHMCETVYMPERTYPMLPGWVSSKHFSLGKDRPSLTFSVKLDEQSNVLEHSIQPGFIRNVLKLTPHQVDSSLGSAGDVKFPAVLLTVGGAPPPPRQVSSGAKLTPKHVKDLQILSRLADRRWQQRLAKGGVYMDTRLADVSLWQSSAKPGLAWDHPWRKGRRVVEGDPVIQVRQCPLVNWYTPPPLGSSTMLVTEMMLIACETAARWCGERRIPGLFRGTYADDHNVMRSPKEYQRDILQPQTDSTGEFPMHLGFTYLRTFGCHVMSTQPYPHRILGMETYGKVTSPLRRYGDMINHWQIESGLRQEATKGCSLRTRDSNPDRSFLPFSAKVLDTVIVGLQPREKLITSSKSASSLFWYYLLLFRAYEFNERTDSHLVPGSTVSITEGSLANLPRKMRVHVIDSPQKIGSHKSFFVGLLVELSVVATVDRPSEYGLDLPDPMIGDVWEVEYKSIDVYYRHFYVTPTRLLNRVGQDGYTGWFGAGPEYP